MNIHIEHTNFRCTVVISLNKGNSIKITLGEGSTKDLSEQLLDISKELLKYTPRANRLDYIKDIIKNTNLDIWDIDELEVYLNDKR